MSTRIKFIGAVRTVTGSMHLLTVDNKNILLDCGLFQGHRKEAFQRNRNFPFDPASIDALVGFTATTANAKANLATIEQSEGLSDERKSELRREQVGNLLTQGGGSAAASFDATREIRSLSRATGKSEAELAGLAEDETITGLMR